MSDKTTPGPWLIDRTKAGQYTVGQYIKKPHSMGTTVFTIKEGLIPTPADGRLIAYSPMLLDACKGFIQIRDAVMACKNENEKQVLNDTSYLLLESVRRAIAIIEGRIEP